MVHVGIDFGEPVQDNQGLVRVPGVAAQEVGPGEGGEAAHHRAPHRVSAVTDEPETVGRPIRAPAVPIVGIGTGEQAAVPGLIKGFEVIAGVGLASNRTGDAPAVFEGVVDPLPLRVALKVFRRPVVDRTAGGIVDGEGAGRDVPGARDESVGHQMPDGVTLPFEPGSSGFEDGVCGLACNGIVCHVLSGEADLFGCEEVHNGSLVK